MNQKFNFDKVAKFIKRLYKLANDEEIKELTWNADGTRIRITNKDMFMKNALHLISKTKEYSTFVRQLNIYGFVKARILNTECEEYYNQNFVRGREDLLPFITREKDKPVSTSCDRIVPPTSKYSIENAIEYLNNHNFRLGNEVDVLKERLDKQERTINGLIEVLSRVFRVGAKNTTFPTLTNNTRAIKDMDAFLNGESMDEKEYHKRRSTHDFDDYFTSLPIEQLCISNNSTKTEDEKNNSKEDGDYYYNDFF